MAMDLSELNNKETHFWKKLLIVLVAIIVIVALVGGGYHLWHDRKHVNTSAKKTTVTVNHISIPNPTQNYSSDNLSLTLNYPSNWVIVDALGSNQMTITSAPLKLLNAYSQPITGKITLTILNYSPSTVTGFNGNSSTASIKSQLVTFANPTPDQIASTYISFAHFPASTTPSNSIDGIYVTGNYGYQVNQDIPQANITSQSPIIYYTFTECSNSTCSGTTKSLSIPASLWQDKNFSGPLLNMISP